MNAKDCNWVTQKLEAFLDNEVDSLTGSEIEKHLSHCEKCRKHLFELREINLIGSREFYNNPPEEYWQTILPRIRKRLNTPQPGVIPLLKRFFAYHNTARNIAGTAAAAAIILIVVHYTGRTPETFTELSQGQKAETSVEKPAGTANTGGLREAKESSVQPNAAAAEKSESKTGEKTEIPPQSPGQITRPAPESNNIVPEEEKAVAADEENELVISSEKKEAEKRAVIEIPTTESEPQKNTAAAENNAEEESPIKKEPLTVKQEEEKDRGTLSAKSQEETWYSQSKTDFNAFYNRAKSRLFSGNPAVPPVQGFRQSEGKITPEVKDTFEEEEYSGDVQSLKEKKNNLLKQLENNNDSVQEIILLKEIDDIYVKILIMEKNTETISEAQSFYTTYKKELTKIIGAGEYNSRIRWLKEM